MNRIAVIIAIALAALGGTMLWLYKQRFEAAVSGGAPVAVTVLARDVPLGAVLSEADLAVRMIPSQFVEGRHVRVAERASVVGVRTATQLRGNDSLMWTDLASSSTFSRNLSGLVRVGMRAVALNLNNGADFSGLIRPGDRVDLMLTVNRGTSKQSTHAIAQAALVVAVGADTGNGAGTVTTPEANPRSGRRGGVTVALTAEHAALVTHARHLGELTIVLRNPDDVAIVDLEAATQALAAAAAELDTGRRPDQGIEQMMNSMDALNSDLSKAVGGTAHEELLRELREFEKSRKTGGAVAVRPEPEIAPPEDPEEDPADQEIPAGLPRPSQVTR